LLFRGFFHLSDLSLFPGQLHPFQRQPTRLILISCVSMNAYVSSNASLPQIRILHLKTSKPHYKYRQSCHAFSTESQPKRGNIAQPMDQYWHTTEAIG
jgi:hypothetical protein